MELKVLLVFLDGVGLGERNPTINPLARASMPYLDHLLEGRKLTADFAPSQGKRFTLLPLDANLGVGGMPQSATGQAVILTGRNVPKEIGYHFGPKPNEAIAEIVSNGNLFRHLNQLRLKTALLNAYPQRYFDAIASGRRLLSSIPLAVLSAGLSLKTTHDLYHGDAMSADFTGQSWRQHLNMPDAPEYSPKQAGNKLYELSSRYNFSFFEYWMSDYAGHSQEMDFSCELLETFDGVLEGLVENWQDEEGIILITSDHGNMEDLSTHRHTNNPVPALLIGAVNLREEFAHGLNDLTGITPSIYHFLNGRHLYPSSGHPGYE
jgi:hypothetical protein